MSENVAVSQCTKHVGFRYIFIHGFIFEILIKIIFVKIIDNDSNTFRNKIGGELHSRRVSRNVFSESNNLVYIVLTSSSIEDKGFPRLRTNIAK